MEKWLRVAADSGVQNNWGNFYGCKSETPNFCSKLNVMTSLSQLSDHQYTVNITYQHLQLVHQVMHYSNTINLSKFKPKLSFTSTKIRFNNTGQNAISIGNIARSQTSILSNMAGFARPVLTELKLVRTVSMVFSILAF